MVDKSEPNVAQQPLLHLFAAINHLADPHNSNFEPVLESLSGAMACHRVLLRLDDGMGRTQTITTHPLPQSLLDPLFTALHRSAPTMTVAPDVTQLQVLQDLQPILQRHHVQSLVYCRLHDDQRALGDLLLTFDSPTAAATIPHDMLQALAAQFAAALAHRHSRQQIAALEETHRASRLSEAMLAEAQRLARLGSWQWDTNANAITWSDELYRIYGISPEQFELTYDNYLQLVHPADRQRLHLIVQNARETYEPFDFYHRIVRADGIVRTLHARGHAVLDGQGNLLGMYGSAQDITDQHQTEEALRKSEKSYRTLARNIPDALVALYDHDLKLTLIEGSISSLLASEIHAGASLRDVLPDADQEGSLQPFYNALSGNAQTLEREYAGRVFQIHALPVRDTDGQIFAGMAMAQEITARKQTEQKLILRAQQLSALHKMGQTVAASLDLDVVFRRVLETLRPLIGAEGVFILLLDGPDTFVFAAADEVGVGNLAGQRVPTTRGVAADVVRTGHLQWLQGDETLERVYHELKEVAHYHPRAIIAAPMHLHGELIGVMETVHSHPDAFGEDERAMMETAASWVAIAIGNARQHGRLHRQLQESKALSEISRALSQTLDLDHILDLIVNSARDLMTHADASIFFFLSHEDGVPTLTPVASAGHDTLSTQFAAQDAGSLLPHPFMSQALATLTDRATDGVNVLTYHQEGGALIAVPVYDRDGNSGLLTVQSASPDRFTADEHRLLAMLGRQATMAVENARLYQDQQQARRTADTLRAANVALSQSLELPVVLNTLLDFTRELIGFHYALILLVHPPHRLTVEAAANMPTPTRRWFAVQDYPLLETILAERQYRILSRAARQADDFLPPDLEPDASSWLVVPLVSGERHLGLLLLGSDNPAAYGVQHATFAEGLAAQATIAIQNARLFAEVQSSHARLRLLSRQIVGAQEAERQRISRELHDEAGQALTALKISLEMMRAAWPDLPDSLDAQLGEAIEMTDQTMEQIRLLAHDLRPPVLDTFGLATSIEGLARDFGRRTNLEMQIQTEHLPDLPDAVAISFYRFVQEALTNVARHAHASKVDIELRRDNDKIKVRVSDDGNGFDADAVLQNPQERAGIGLMGMQDRFELLNGWIEIETAPGQGTSVSAYVPYQEDE